MLSTNQFLQLLEVVRSEGERRAKLQAGHNKIEHFGGKLDRCDDWSFAFRRTIRSMHSSCYKLRIDAESRGGDVEEVTDFDKEQDLASGELYDTRCQVRRGRFGDQGRERL